MTNSDTTMRSTAMTATAVCAALLLAACTGHKKDATQTAARVDGTEITVHQINYRLQRERGLRPEQQDEASRKILDQLIDEQLVVEKAEKTKLDLEPAAQQALAAARRDVLARAYVEQAAQGVPAPTEPAIHAYFDANPFLFSQRRIYTLQEYLANVPEDRIATLRTMVEGGRPPEEVEAWFKAQGTPFRGQQSTHPAEQIPLGSLKAIAGIPVGHGIVASAGPQVHVTYVTSSADAPVGYDKARPAVAQFLTIEARRKVTEANLAALKTAAAIQYAAPYEALAASGATLATLKDIEAPAPAPTASGTRISLPAAAEASSVRVSLPAAASGVHVSLPQTPGLRVSLPAPATPDATKK